MFGLAALALKFAPVTGFFKAVPRWVWIALAVIALVVVARIYHERKANAALTAAYAHGVTDTKEAFRVAQAKADATQRAKVARIVKAAKAISKDVSHALTEANSSIDARARALSLQHDAAARERARRSGNLSASGAAAGAAQCPAASDGLPWSDALPLMTQAAKDLAQLNAILDWDAKQQALADKTAEGARP